jgi:hypothetical protein
VHFCCFTCIWKVWHSFSDFTKGWKSEIMKQFRRQNIFFFNIRFFIIHLKRISFALVFLDSSNFMKKSGPLFTLTFIKKNIILNFLRFWSWWEGTASNLPWARDGQWLWKDQSTTTWSLPGHSQATSCICLELSHSLAGSSKSWSKMLFFKSKPHTLIYLFLFVKVDQAK